MNRRKHLIIWLCLLPAVGVLLCIVQSLRGYEPPVYALEEVLQAAADEETDAKILDSMSLAKTGEGREESPVQAEAQELPTLPDGPYADGVYEVTVDCYDQESEAMDAELNFDYSITMQITIADNRIVVIFGVEGKPSAYNPEYDPKNDIYISMAQMGMGDMPGVVPQILAEQSYDVDVVSGATYSSWAFMEAAWRAMEKARP